MWGQRIPPAALPEEAGLSEAVKTAVSKRNLPVLHLPASEFGWGAAVGKGEDLLWILETSTDARGLAEGSFGPDG